MYEYFSLVLHTSNYGQLCMISLLHFPQIEGITYTWISPHLALLANTSSLSDDLRDKLGISRESVISDLKLIEF